LVQKRGKQVAKKISPEIPALNENWRVTILHKNGDKGVLSRILKGCQPPLVLKLNGWDRKMYLSSYLPMSEPEDREATYVECVSQLGI
jgi:hypothetical protein